MTIEKSIEAVRERLTSHEIYGTIQTVEELRIFMSAHVFAVWDFMSLAKRLQIDMTCVSLPWIAPKEATASHLINEIILYEESDIGYDGKPASHLEMYLDAMKDVDADASMFNNFMAELATGKDIPAALEAANIPEYIAGFVKANTYCAMNSELVEVASSFLFGREDAIPDMFTLFLEKWGMDKEQIPALVYYLERHIDLDGDEHGPAAQKMLDGLIGGDAEKEKAAARSAEFAIEDRISLWDGVVAEIKKLRESQKEGASQLADA